MKNKYGINFEVGDYVYLPLAFYGWGVWKIIKIVDESDTGRTRRLWLDQGRDDNGERHIRGLSIDNVFIKVDKECGEYLHGGDFYLDLIDDNEYGHKEWKRRTLEKDK